MAGKFTSESDAVIDKEGYNSHAHTTSTVQLTRTLNLNSTTHTHIQPQQYRPEYSGFPLLKKRNKKLAS